MKRSSMKCVTCVKFHHGECRLQPVPLKIPEPAVHWCAQGQWEEWSERYGEMQPFFWGEWDDEW